MKALFFRILEQEHKSSALLRAVQGLAQDSSGFVFETDPSDFLSVPGSPFSYWVSPKVRETFKTLPRYASNGREAQHGLSTKNDFRFLRLSWEHDSRTEEKWMPFAKGGAFSPYYADLHLVVNWQSEGKEIEAEVLQKYPYLNGNAEWVLHRECSYRRQGLTWPRRTNGLSMRVLPAGCLFADKGPATFVKDNDEDELFATAAIANSKAFGLLVSLQLARTELAQSFEVGLIQQTPVPLLDEKQIKVLASLAFNIWAIKHALDTHVENSHSFTLPAVLQVNGQNLDDRVKEWLGTVASRQSEIASLQDQIDTLCWDLYGVSHSDSSRSSFPTDLSDVDVKDNDEDDFYEDEASQIVGAYASRVVLARDLASWALGVAFGRFDIRLATDAMSVPAVPKPFEPLPLCSPGILADISGRPAELVPSSYPLIPADAGIIVDDPGHPSDLESHIRRVFQLVFKKDADVWLKDVAETLDPARADIRRWFAGEFFDFHLRRYTKSKRKAPIYWQVSVPSGRYSIWLYAPKLTADSLFRLQQDVLAPKVAHEERTLASMRQDGTFRSTQAQRELEAQDSLVSELRQLADEIQRVAPLWNPDLDDGTVLAMSPLWRLIPLQKAWQKELRSKWQDLQSGKYDWAHLAMHLWPERVVPKCADDHSLAIAHGLEEEFWFEDEAGKWKPRKTPRRSIEDLIAERTSAAVKDALANLLEAPEPVAPGKRTRKSKVA